MKQYLDLLKKIKEEGVSSPDRTGSGRRRIFGTGMRFDLSTGEFPLVTTREVYTTGFIEELLWFIRGDTDVERLKEKNVNIWNHWAVKDTDLDDFFNKIIKPHVIKYLDNTGELDLSKREQLISQHLMTFKTSSEAYIDKIGPMYGAIWRNAPAADVNGLIPNPDYDDIPSDKLGYYKDEYLELYNKESLLGADPNFREWAVNRYVSTIDQLQNLILNLKRDPYSSRHLVTALIPQYRSVSGFSPQENVLLNKGALDPCHTFFQCFVYPPKEEGGKQRLSLKMYQRSVDTPIGLVFNVAQYALLTHLLAHVTDMEPYEFIWDGGDTHIYLNQLDLIDEQLSREPQPLPKLWLNPGVKDLFQFTSDDIKILDYNPLPKIKYPISV